MLTGGRYSEVAVRTGLTVYTNLNIKINPSWFSFFLRRFDVNNILNRWFGIILLGLIGKGGSFHS